MRFELSFCALGGCECLFECGLALLQLSGGFGDGGVHTTDVGSIAKAGTLSVGGGYFDAGCCFIHPGVPLMHLFHRDGALCGHIVQKLHTCTSRRSLLFVP